MEWDNGRHGYLPVEEDSNKDAIKDDTLPWQVFKIRAQCSFALNISVISVIFEIMQLYLQIIFENAADKESIILG